jgi:hypothetical protein
MEAIQGPVSPQVGGRQYRNDRASKGIGQVIPVETPQQVTVRIFRQPIRSTTQKASRT